MKKITKILAAVATLTATTIPLTTLVACGSEEEPEPGPQPGPTPVDPRISRDDLNIENGVLYGLKEGADISECTTLEIPSDVVSIADDAFNGVFTKDGGNNNITNITFADEANGELTIGNNAFNNCDAINNNLELPSFVKTIGLNAFAHTSIQTVELNEGLQIIGPGAFAKTPISNNKLIIPASVTRVESGAFYSCTNLTGTLEISSSLTELCTNSFANSKISFLDLTKIKDVTDPTKLKFDDGCFYNFPSQVGVASWFASTDLETFVEKLQQDYSYGSIEKVIPSTLTVESDFTYELNGESDYAIITGLASSANEPSTCDTLYIPQTYTKDGVTYDVTRIKQEAFANFDKTQYPNLSVIYFPTDSKITSIGSGAFADSQFTNLVKDGQGNVVSVPLTIPNSVTSIGSEAFAETNLNCTLSVQGHVGYLGGDAFDVGNDANLFVTPETSPRFAEIPSGTFAKCSIKYNAYYNIVISQQLLHTNSLNFKNINNMKAIVLSGWTKFKQAQFDGNPFGIDISTIDGQIVYPPIFDEQEEYDAANYTLLKNEIVPASWLANYNPEMGFIKCSGPTVVKTTSDSYITGVFNFELAHPIAQPRGLKCDITLQYSTSVEGQTDIFKVHIDQTKIVVDGTKVSVPVTFDEGYIAENVDVYFYVKFSYMYDNRYLIWEQEIDNQLILQCGDLPIHFASSTPTQITMENAVAHAHVLFNSENELSGIDVDLMEISHTEAWELGEMTCRIISYAVGNKQIDLELRFESFGGDVEAYDEFKKDHTAVSAYIGYMISDLASDWTGILIGQPSAIQIQCK